MRCIEGILLDLQLSLKEIDRVLELWVRNAMDRHSVLVVLVSALIAAFVQFVYQVVNLVFERCDALRVLVAKLIRRCLDKIVHVLRIVETRMADRSVILSRNVVFYFKLNALTPVFSI